MHINHLLRCKVQTTCQLKVNLMYVGLCHEKTCLRQFGGRPTQCDLCANAQLDLGVSIADLSTLCTFWCVRAKDKYLPTHSCTGLSLP